MLALPPPSSSIPSPSRCGVWQLEELVFIICPGSPCDLESRLSTLFQLTLKASIDRSQSTSVQTEMKTEGGGASIRPPPLTCSLVGEEEQVNMSDNAQK